MLNEKFLQKNTFALLAAKVARVSEAAAVAMNINCVKLLTISSILNCNPLFDYVKRLE